jgi:hypothetical protein
VADEELTELQEGWRRYELRAEKLAALRAARNNQRGMWRDRPCVDCGVVMRLHKRYPRCPDCKRQRHLEAMRRAQKRRRWRVLRDRGLMTGTGTYDCLTFLKRKPVRCAHCKEKFVPQRTTGRFCSAKCRVAAHRRRK